jgi:hypothetical protein
MWEILDIIIRLGFVITLIYTIKQTKIEDIKELFK